MASLPPALPPAGLSLRIEQPLEAKIGDPARGQAIVANPASTCTLCHAGPFPHPELQGDVGPDLHGVGARLTVPELRAQLVEPRTLDPASVMPSFYRAEGLTRVGPAWQDKSILSAQQIEDAIAYLATLK